MDNSSAGKNVGMGRGQWLKVEFLEKQGQGDFSRCCWVSPAFPSWLLLLWGDRGEFGGDSLEKFPFSRAFPSLNPAKLHPGQCL